MVEFESLQAAQLGMPHVNVKPEILQVHGFKVFNNCIKMPSVYISDSMFTEQSYREILQGNK
jgi:sulfur oxygenase/reductase